MVERQTADSGQTVQPACPDLHGSVQVNQTDLTYVNPAQREAAGGARTALGTEYELQLRREAGPKPGKQANRKHQISSLYHLSKVRVGVVASALAVCAV